MFRARKSANFRMPIFASCFNKLNYPKKMTEQQFYGEIAKMIMEALKKVEHDLNLAVGEMKITLELIKLDRFRVTSMLMRQQPPRRGSHASCRVSSTPSIPPYSKGGMTRGAHPEGHDETTGAEKPRCRRSGRSISGTISTRAFRASKRGEWSLQTSRMEPPNTPDGTTKE